MDSAVATSVLGLAATVDGDTAIAISAGSTHTCVLLRDASIRCFGQNIHGELGDGRTLDRAAPVATLFSRTAISVAAAVHYTCALMRDNSVQCVGQGDRGQLGNGAFTPSLSPVAVSLPGNLTVKSVATKYDQTCVLTSDGRLWCWGLNNEGQLGNGTKADSSSPVEPSSPFAD